VYKIDSIRSVGFASASFHIFALTAGVLPEEGNCPGG